MIVADLFSPYDPEDLDEVAVPFLNAIVALTAFSRAGRDDVDPIFEAATAKALLYSLAAFIAQPHHPGEQQDVLLEQTIAFLRAQVAEIRGAQ